VFCVTRVRDERREVVRVDVRLWLRPLIDLLRLVLVLAVLRDDWKLLVLCPLGVSEAVFRPLLVLDEALFWLPMVRYALEVALFLVFGPFELADANFFGPGNMPFLLEGFD
jgi:hypothetical protein